MAVDPDVLTITDGLEARLTALESSPAAIQPAIDAAASAGGGVVCVPDGNHIIGQLTMRTKVTLRGNGVTSKLTLADGTNDHMLVLEDENTDLVTIENLFLDGNKVNQTAGDVIHFDGTGTTHDGFTFGQNSQHRIKHVTILDAYRDGVYLEGDHRDSHLIEVWSRTAGRRGFHIGGPDAKLRGCVSGRSGEEGFYLNAGNLQLDHCKSFGSGLVTPSRGYGFWFDWVTRTQMSNCLAQDNFADGFHGKVFNGTLVGISADTNGTDDTGRGLVLDGAEHCLISINVLNRRGSARGANATLYGVEIKGDADHNLIDLVTDDLGGADVLYTTAQADNTVRIGA